MRFRRATLLCVLAVLLWPACVDAGSPQAVLFIGNSYSFELPAMMAKLASAQHPEARFELAATGGQTLAGHVRSGTMNRLTNRWDVVVLQEQSQIPALGAQQIAQISVPAATTLVAAIRSSGATPLLYQTWGRRDGDKSTAGAVDDFTNMQARLIAGYDQLAAATQTRVVPAGRAWQLARARHPGIELYAPDGSHPSPAGVYLVACVFHATFFAEDPAGLHENGGLPPATARQLREVARDAVRSK